MIKEFPEFPIKTLFLKLKNKNISNDMIKVIIVNVSWPEIIERNNNQ